MFRRRKLRLNSIKMKQGQIIDGGVNALLSRTDIRASKARYVGYVIPGYLYQE